MNSVQLIGRIASAIKVEEVNTSLGLRPRASLLLAVRRRVRDAAEPDWIRMEVWGANADNLAKYCEKGRLVAVEGHVIGRFLDPSGETRGGRLRLLVVGDSVSYLDRPASSTSESARDDVAD